MLAARVRLLIVTLWVGSLWTVGYMVAPSLFATLNDKVLAGSIAGSLFRIEAWLSVCCAIMLTALTWFVADRRSGKSDKRVWWIIAGMLACTVIGYFGIHPYMAVLKESAGPGGVMAAGVQTQFGILHGVSSAFYLVQSLLGVTLVLAVR